MKVKTKETWEEIVAGKSKIFANSKKGEERRGRGQSDLARKPPKKIKDERTNPDI